MAQLHYITAHAGGRRRGRPLEVQHGNYYSQRQEDFFFEYVREQLIHRYGRAPSRRAG